MELSAQYERPFVIIHSDDKNPKEIQFPLGVKKIEFRHYSSKGSEKKIVSFPDTILELELNINYSLDFIILPKSLIRLILGNYFNFSIKNFKFPETLKYLIFGCQFDQDIRNLNFPQLIELTTGFYFNQDIRNANLPESLICLTLGNWVNQDIKDANFPKSLKYIEKIVPVGYSKI